MKHLLKLSYAPKDHEIKVKYVQSTPDGRIETVTLESAEEPKAELVSALQAMVPHVIALGELPDEWADDLTVRGVTINRGEAVGLTITALRQLEDIMTPLVLNTPYTTEIGKNCLRELEELERQALAYVDGQRAQLQLGLREGASA